MIDITDLQDLVGTEFPAGTFTIQDHEHWLCTDAVLSPALPEGVAHPMYGYYAAIAGMGKSLDEIFADAGATAADGPMFGEAELEFRRPLRVGATYTVAGRYVSAVRKEGKRAGVFDIVAFELEVVDDTGAVAAVSTNSFVYPRRETET
jgi:acyl dehydratase